MTQIVYQDLHNQTEEINNAVNKAISQHLNVSLDSAYSILSQLPEGALFNLTTYSVDYKDFPVIIIDSRTICSNRKEFISNLHLELHSVDANMIFRYDAIVDTYGINGLNSYISIAEFDLFYTGKILDEIEKTKKFIDASKFNPTISKEIKNYESLLKTAYTDAYLTLSNEDYFYYCGY